jgi:hypothetical protein
MDRTSEVAYQGTPFSFVHTKNLEPRKMDLYLHSRKRDSLDQRVPSLLTSPGFRPD